MPPAPLDERPEKPPKRVEESDSEDDNGFGPALPPSDANGKADGEAADDDEELANPQKAVQQPQEKLRRDEWMTMAPKQDDLAARLDPTKQRPSKFNTGKGARSGKIPEDDSAAWHETPEQKQKRLADEMMGVSKPSSIGPQKPSDAVKDEAAAWRIREHAEKTRGPSLLDQHQHSTTKEAEDDPSKRAFDRDKDMSTGMRIGHSQRKEMLNKASNFSSKFAGGSYL